jgi:hypothetical protein
MSAAPNPGSIDHSAIEVLSLSPHLPTPVDSDPCIHCPAVHVLHCWPQEITATQVVEALNNLVPVAGSIIQQCRVVVELPAPQRTDLRQQLPRTHQAPPSSGPLPLSTKNVLMLDQQMSLMGLQAAAFVTVYEPWQLDLLMEPPSSSPDTSTQPGGQQAGGPLPPGQPSQPSVARQPPHANGPQGESVAMSLPC